MPIEIASDRYTIPLQLTRLQGDDEDRRRPEYGVTFIRAGLVRQRDGQPSNWRILPDALKAAVPLFNSLGMQIDHASVATWFYPSLKDTAGVTFNARWNADNLSIDGGARLYGRDDLVWLRQFLDELLEDQEAGREVPDVGLSAVIYQEAEYVEIPNGNQEKQTTKIKATETVDFVFGPGAEGRLREALQFMQSFGVVVPTIGGNQVDENEVVEETQQGGIGDTGEQDLAAHRPQRSAPASNASNGDTGQRVGSAVLDGDTQALSERVSRLEAAIVNLGGLTDSVERLTGALAQQEESTVVEGMGIAPRAANFRPGFSSLERVEAAFMAMLNGVLPPTGVPPLSGIRELYHLMSGDYEMSGVYQSDRVYLANVNSSTMAGMVANALNKVVINMFADYPRWWAPAVTEMDFMSLQDVRWITLGGIGELPTVAEGASYTELTWDDQTETDSFVKKGGYLGLTIEAIDKDDTGQLRAAPAALARAAWLTLGKSISAIFTDNSGTGPTMSDSNALFDASNHSNLSTTATLSPANWRATKIAMMKQTELNSSERLGALTKPYLIWVPVDLEDYALEILGSEGKADTANNNVNVDAAGETRTARLGMANDRVIACPFWTDTDNWAAQADPRLYPSIGIGYRYGRMPEIFSVASPTAGLMFTNDTMPIKVRFFFAVGPTDWRGLYKVNIA